jgi:calcineurin-like phosphoesterase family protein
MTNWFTSDWHFDHRNIMKYCPDRVRFLGLASDEDVDGMNAALVDLWNNTVQPDDTVYFLGDFAMGQIKESIWYTDQLNGIKHMIWGNHDRPHPVVSKDPVKRQEWIDLYAEAGWTTQRQDGFYNFPNGYTALLNHFPYHGDSEEQDRYPGARPEDQGLPLIHGHIHDLWRVEGRQINVGLDAWGRLLTEEEVGGLVKNVVG